MKSATRSLGRAAAALLGGGAVLVAASSTAAAAPLPPNCTTADVTAVVAGVSSGMTGYLFTHPDVNAFFTGLQGQSKSAAAQQTREYLDANPQVRAEVTSIRQPAIDLRNRCGIPLAADISGVL